MGKQVEIKWLPEPEEKNYPAAESYLRLIYDKMTVEAIVSKLKSTPVSPFKAQWNCAAISGFPSLAAPLP